jgi:GNAT superfamily N-acetyltransferase
MEFELLGWADEGPTLRLDYEQFSYAGKFVMSSTGKSVLRDGDQEIVAAAAFDPDRTDDSTLRIRYVTVRRNRQGDGLGARLLRTVRDRAVEAAFDRVVIAVNNPFAYEAAVKAGFGYTGERTGVAEHVLSWPTGERESRYFEGLERFLERDLAKSERAFIDSREGPPPVVEPYTF